MVGYCSSLSRNTLDKISEAAIGGTIIFFKGVKLNILYMFFFKKKKYREPLVFSNIIHFYENYKREEGIFKSQRGTPSL